MTKYITTSEKHLFNLPVLSTATCLVFISYALIGCSNIVQADATGDSQYASSAPTQAEVNTAATTLPPSNAQSALNTSALIQLSDYQAFAEEVSLQHGFSRSELDRLFSQVQINPEIIAKMTKPAEGIAWHRYQNIFIQQERMQAGADYWSEHADLLAAAEQKTGVPPEIIAGIIGVETYYGRFKGTYPVIEALATLGFDYPKRGAFFRKQLAAFLVLARDNNFDPLAIKGSYAGAMGLPQFIPTSYQAYAVDGDGDGNIDLFNNHADVIFSVANYFAEHNWQAGEPVAFRATGSRNGAWRNTDPQGQKLTSTVAALANQGMDVPDGVKWNESARVFDFTQKRDDVDYIEYWLALNNFYVITRYNHSKLYALAVFQLAQGIKANY